MFCKFWVAGWPPVWGGGGLFILFAASAFRGLSSIYVLFYFPFGFGGRMWDLVVSVPDHCLSFYFPHNDHYHSKIKKISFKFQSQLLLPW